MSAAVSAVTDLKAAFIPVGCFYRTFERLEPDCSSCEDRPGMGGTEPPVPCGGGPGPPRPPGGAVTPAVPRRMLLAGSAGPGAAAAERRSGRTDRCLSPQAVPSVRSGLQQRGHAGIVSRKANRQLHRSTAALCRLGQA